jgi:DNA polymerase III delta prime subunit
MNVNHHAICFVGESLDELIENTARAILCGGSPPTERRFAAGEAVSPCDNCNSCRKALNNVHPDIIRVRESMTDGKYKVGELRGILSEAGLRPNDGEHKVYVFTNADTMRPECQNTLLKFTEEPPGFVRIIFGARSADMLLETIKSRLVFINADSVEAVHDPAHSEIAKMFMEGLNGNDEYAAATALSRVRTRDELGAVLGIIAGEIRSTMHNSANMKAWARAQEFLQDCIDDLKFNPNISLACSYITAGVNTRANKR